MKAELTKGLIRPIELAVAEKLRPYIGSFINKDLKEKIKQEIEGVVGGQWLLADLEVTPTVINFTLLYKPAYLEVVIKDFIDGKQ